MCFADIYMYRCFLCIDYYSSDDKQLLLWIVQVMKMPYFQCLRYFTWLIRMTELSLWWVEVCWSILLENWCIWILSFNFYLGVWGGEQTSSACLAFNNPSLKDYIFSLLCWVLSRVCFFLFGCMASSTENLIVHNIHGLQLTSCNNFCFLSLDL